MWAEPLFTAGELRTLEGAHPGGTGELMERAGVAVAELALRSFPQARSFCLWCGTGANGGDGFVAARQLQAAGRAVTVFLAGSSERVSADAAVNLQRLRELGLEPSAEPAPADVAIDALFGTGFSGKPRPEAARVIEALNGTGAPVLAVDLASGVDASTGEVAGVAVQADYTVTFHAPKVGHLVAPGRFQMGEVEVVDIGLPGGGETLHGRVSERILEAVPRRGPRDSKYSAGSVLVVGGSVGLTGAPCLTAEAALRAGAGVVTACIPASLNPVFEQRLLEVMTLPCPDREGVMVEAAAERILEAARKATAVALGPGLGRTEGVQALVRRLLGSLELPVVVDADALFALAGNSQWVFERDLPTVLTPHAGELARLLGRDSSWVDAHRLDAVREAADELGAVVLLKGVDTLIASPGKGALVCDLGNPGLASAGTGDVLTGVIGAFLAKGMEPRLAAAAAAAAGGVAARLAAERHGFAGLIARDLIESLSLALS